MIASTDRTPITFPASIAPPYLCHSGSRMRSASRDNFSEKDSLGFRCAFTDIQLLLFTNQSRAPYANGPAGHSGPLRNPKNRLRIHRYFFRLQILQHAFVEPEMKAEQLRPHGQ